MPFEIQIRKHDEIDILHLNGKLVAGEPAEALRTELYKLSGEGRNRVILDMSSADYIDSTGLGALVMWHTKLNNAGGGLRLLNLSTRGLELLVLTKLSTVFELFDDEQNAVNSFFPDREIRRFDILSFVESQKAKKKG